MRVELKAV
jgi:hypothetical protein